MSLYHPVDIGSLHLDGNLFLAPIAGYSDMAFRSLCTEYGASLCTTEMVSSEALVRHNKKTELLMRRAPNEKVYCVQIFGGNPQTMAQAARIVLEKTDCNCIDINGGCPVPKIVKTGAGSMLTKEPERLFSVVKAVKDSSIEYTSCNPQRGAVPVTVKIRSGWDSSNITWKECADAALQAGADAITIHARTKAQGYSGKADWEIQRQLAEFVAGRIPVFGSGDAFTPEDAKLMLEQTRVDAVMFARGAMGDPFLFRRTKQFLTEGKYQAETPAERLSAGMCELEMNVAEHGERAACMLMRKKFCAYSSGIKGGSRLREQIVNAVSVEDYKNLFSQFI
ncbi:tRNA dihydrouridine synthase DusB [Treponema sp.]|uniref:tRNA dihydrouridine synthase DusB n=1 Tax=Treponema sp. TaxID=166 RepID=UPI003EFBFDFD